MSKLSKPVAELTSRVITWGLSAILLLMPFHAFFSIYLGSIGFNQSIIQSWKEVLVVVLAFCWILLCFSRRRLYLRFDATNVLFVAIIFVSLIVTIFVRPDSSAVLFGIKTNLVAIALYLIAQIPIPSKAFIKQYLPWLVIIPGVIVSIFAILQSTVLPVTVMEHLGYNTGNINPRQIVDGSLAFYRAFSTLGGPNQLGNFLILPLIFTLVYGIKQKKWWLLGFSLIISLAITLSFSRSAWVGAIIAIVAALLLVFNNRQRLVFGGVITVMAVVGLIVAPVVIRSNPRLENVIFHGRIFENRIEGSDQSRLDAVSNTTKVIIEQPFGHGLGSAGPASFQTPTPVIPENWYLQIAYEIGVIGLVLYILAFAGLLGDFIRHRNLALSASLFGVTCGILISSLFLHTWADSTLALVVFSLYGIYKGRSA